MTLHLFHTPSHRLRVVRENDRCWLDAKPTWAAPLSRPGKYLALLDSKNEEITLLESPQDELSPESWRAAREELRRRDLTARVSKITSAREEYGATYWSVQTDRGARDFVMQNLAENAIWVSDTHLLLVDAQGNRFEIANTDALDARSQTLLFGVV